MCIIVPEAKEVGDTKIFVAPIAGNKQLTVYSNRVNLERPAAMILPFPKGSLPYLVNLENYTDLFYDLASHFPEQLSIGMLINSKSSEFDLPLSSPLEVHTVGSYSVSIADNLEDLSRLRKDVFQITGDVGVMFSQYYSSGYSFMVCIMKAGAKFHPIGYVHSRLSDKSMFIPTRHYHGHLETNPDWDHQIYVMNSKGVGIDGRFKDSDPNNGVTKRLVELTKWPFDFDKFKLLFLQPKNLWEITVNKNYYGNHDITAL